MSRLERCRAVQVACATALLLTLAAAGGAWAQGDATGAAAFTDRPTVGPSGVAVYRGTPAREVMPAAASRSVPGAETYASGDRLWQVDRAAGTLTACELVRTSKVGRSAIRCFERDLP